MAPHSRRSYKRKHPTLPADSDKHQNKCRKINTPTDKSINSASTSPHGSLVDLIRRSRTDSGDMNNNNALSTSTDAMKNKYIQQLQEDLDQLDVVDIRKRKLARMWNEKQRLENKIDDKLREQEIFNQDETRSVELSLATTVDKLQAMEKNRRSQLEKLLIQLKESRENNWELMHMVYQYRQENEDLKTRLRKMHNIRKNKKSLAPSWNERNSIFEERKSEAIVNCTLILMCAYILYKLAADTVARWTPNNIKIEEIESHSSSEDHEDCKISED